MAPNLASSQHDMIRDMILSNSKNVDIVAAVGCSDRAVTRIRSHLRHFGATKAPSNGSPGPRRRITPSMLEVLRDRLLKKSGLYQDEMVVFLHDEFGVLVDASTISRALKTARWTKKVIRQMARQRSKDLRDFYLHNLSNFKSYHLVFVDESGCDKRIGFRRTGWSPLGVAPVQVAKFRGDCRYQILPAYSQEGVLLSRVFQGTTDSAMYEDYIEQLLQHCEPFPKPRSVLVMDNAFFHHTDRIKQMCRDAGVKLLYLPPYSPDLNPIEEFLAELKGFIRRNWHEFENNPQQKFGAFLEWCLAVVGAKVQSARGHFSHAGITVEDF